MSSLISVIAGSRRRFDPDALAYFSRITAAGSSITDGNKLAVDAFIKGCKTDGVWSAIKASCLLAGPDTLDGALVPLAGAAPTNVGFLDADYNRTTGIQGGAEKKWLNSNRVNSADLQNDCSLALWITTVPTFTYGVAVASATNVNGTAARNLFVGSVLYSAMCNNGSSNANTTHSTTPKSTGFLGISRNDPEFHLFRTAGVTDTVNKASNGLSAGGIRIFGQGNNSNIWSDAGISFYSIGAHLDLALLDARLATYMSSLT
jgi:hypothetical protein